MLRSTRRSLVWIGLLAFSAVIHALVSWRVGQKIEPLVPPPPQEAEVQIVMEQPPEPLIEKPEPPEEQLEFQEELELDPPEILIAPKAVAPPPPDVTVAIGVTVPDWMCPPFQLTRSPSSRSTRAVTSAALSEGQASLPTKETR